MKLHAKFIDINTAHLFCITRRANGKFAEPGERNTIFAITGIHSHAEATGVKLLEARTAKHTTRGLIGLYSHYGRIGIDLLYSQITIALPWQE